MRKVCKWLCYPMAAIAVLLFSFSVFVGTQLPDTFTVETGTSVQLAQFPYVQQRAERPQELAVVGVQQDTSYATQLRLFGVIPVKEIRAVQSARRTVTVCGTPFGVKMFTDGALVVSFTDISTSTGSRNPAKTAGIKTGDIIKSVAGKKTKTNEDIIAALQALKGAPAEVIYVRGGVTYNTLLTAVLDKSTGTYRAGMWVRDSSAGIGTLTFCDMATGVFAGLGHSIHDADTGDSLTLRTGEIVSVDITGFAAGASGSPGELKGRFSSGPALGEITVNGETGVYGTLCSTPQGTVMPVAFVQEIQAGYAEMITTINGTTPQRYSVVIEKITLNGQDSNRNMVVRVTDERLLTQTGGIIQGMSGSPIIQNGRFVGSVTHVLVNDPTRGYAIFAENMLATADNVAQAA